MGRRCRLRVLLSDEALMPLTGGVLRPFVVLPGSVRGWDEARVARILTHEIGHQVRHDFLWHLFARAVCALCWFNPLAWYAASRQRIEAEVACDDLVLGTGDVAEGYAEDLLRLLRDFPKGLNTPFVSLMARRSQIKVRLESLLDGGRSRQAVGRSAVFGLVFSVMLVVFTATSVRVVCATGQKIVEAESKSVHGEPARVKDVPAKRLAVKVRDMMGKPIQGVKIVGLPGSEFDEKRLALVDKPSAVIGEAVTDAQGMATVVYAANNEMEKAENKLWLQFSCDGFATSQPIGVKRLDLVLSYALSKAAKVEITAHLPQDEKIMGRYEVAWKGEGVTGGGVEWKVEGNRLTHDRISPVNSRLFLIFKADDGRRFYSKRIELSVNEGETRHMEVDLKPGAVISGRLDEKVKRPVKWGIAAARMEQENAVAKIAEDGSFSLGPLPPEGQADIVAVMRDAAAELTSQEIGELNQGQVFELRAERTGEAKIRVALPDGKALAGTVVSMSIDWFGKGGGNLNFESILGPSGCSWAGITDASGELVISGVPPGTHGFYVSSFRDKYYMPMVFVQGLMRRQGLIAVESGKTTVAEMRLIERGSMKALPKDKQVMISARLLKFPVNAEILRSEKFRQAWLEGNSDQILRLGDESKGVDFLSLPVIVTSSGMKAVMLRVKELYYPTERDFENEIFGWPVEFDMEKVGLTVTCQPYIMDEGIALNMGIYSVTVAKMSMQTQDMNFNKQEMHLARFVKDGGSFAVWLPWEQGGYGLLEQGDDVPAKYGLVVSAKLADK
jgi:hypothetical protein